MFHSLSTFLIWYDGQRCARDCSYVMLGALTMGLTREGLLPRPASLDGYRVDLMSDIAENMSLEGITAKCGEDSVDFTILLIRDVEQHITGLELQGPPNGRKRVRSYPTSPDREGVDEELELDHDVGEPIRELES